MASFFYVNLNFYFRSQILGDRQGSRDFAGRQFPAAETSAGGHPAVFSRHFFGLRSAGGGRIVAL